MWVPEQQREVENCGSGDIPRECSTPPTCLPITLRQAAAEAVAAEAVATRGPVTEWLPFSEDAATALP